MATRILVLLLFGMSQGSSAQLFLPLPDSGAVWSEGYSVMGQFITNTRLGILGDTTIGSFTYRKLGRTASVDLIPSEASYHAAIREANGIWSVIDSGGVEERLLYDLNSEVGDTVEVVVPFSMWTNPIVMAIDTIELNGSLRRRWHLDDPNALGWIEYWIEGIGSTNGLFHATEQLMEIGSRLLCFKQEDSIVYVDPWIMACAYLTGLEEHRDAFIATIVPNPVVSSSVLSVDRPIAASVLLEVRNALDRIVLRSRSDTGTFLLDAVELQPGWFAYRVRDLLLLRCLLGCFLSGLLGGCFLSGLLGGCFLRCFLRCFLCHDEWSVWFKRRTMFDAVLRSSQRSTHLALLIS
jgi:hypothetical protein